MRMLLAGNWKMNGLKSALGEIRAATRVLADEPAPCDVLICPPATIVAEAVRAAEGGLIAIGGQDCHGDAVGAFTGDIAAEMLRDAGATFVIAGHSERRQYHGETDTQIAGKARGARRGGLIPIVCVGESEAQRDAGKASSVVESQLKGSIPDEAGELVVAYEPVWAIGTGRTPTLEQIADMHGVIRNHLVGRFGDAGTKVRILYGGSVKPSNAGEILALADVDGALVGGASLKAADFIAIIRAAPKR